MYGLLIETVIEYTKRIHGEQIWGKVREKAKITIIIHKFNKLFHKYKFILLKLFS